MLLCSGRFGAAPAQVLVPSASAVDRHAWHINSPSILPATQHTTFACSDSSTFQHDLCHNDSVCFFAASHSQFNATTAHVSCTMCAGQKLHMQLGFWPTSLLGTNSVSCASVADSSATKPACCTSPANPSNWFAGSCSTDMADVNWPPARLNLPVPAAAIDTCAGGSNEFKRGQSPCPVAGLPRQC